MAVDIRGHPAAPERTVAMFASEDDAIAFAEHLCWFLGLEFDNIVGYDDQPYVRPGERTAVPDAE